MSESDLELVISKYGRLEPLSDNGIYFAIALYGPGDVLFYTGFGSYRGAIIEIYDELRYHLMVATGSIEAFR